MKNRRGENGGLCNRGVLELVDRETLAIVRGEIEARSLPRNSTLFTHVGYDQVVEENRMLRQEVDRLKVRLGERMGKVEFVLNGPAEEKVKVELEDGELDG